jgi:hypothetical protein
MEVETTRVEGNDLVKNGVYNIYQKDRNVNVGVCLVISDYNINNRNKIILRKLIGNNQLSLNKSEIYGKIPVDLTRANLTGAILIRADLTGAFLTRANLTGAILIRADLTDSHLIGADLTDAILGLTNLTHANLTSATIFQDRLSEEQRRQIIGQPNYIQRPQRIQVQVQAQGYLNISKELSNGNRISLSTRKILNNSNFKTQHRISFTRLLDFLLQEENQSKIARRIRIGGEEGIDAGGITLIIFQKCYEAFMERYFYPYEEEDNSNYVVLKDLTDKEFEEFKKACEFMILLAKKIKDRSGQPFQILIPINFLLFQVLIFEENPETFFELGNKNKFFGKRENGRYSNQHKLNNPFNYIAKNSINNNKHNFSIQRIYEGKYNNNNNNQNNNNNNNQNNNNNKQSTIAQPDTNQNSKKFNAFSEDEQKKLMFLMLLKQNHISKRKQYETMKKFIDEIFKPNKDMFTTSIDYSYDAFVKRLKFKLSSESHNRNLESFESLEMESNPLIKLLLEYIKVSDEYRMVMTAYVCGSYCYTGDIKISIFENPSKFPFQSHTCSKELWVYVNPNNPESFNWLKNKPTNSDYSIEGLYNVFLDRTTQTY